MKGDSPAHSQIANRPLRLEDELIETTVHSDAVQKLEQERAVLHRFEKLDSSAKPTVEGGLTHFTYLEDYWVKKELMRKTWSKHGRQVTAQLLKCAFEFVLPTNNHFRALQWLTKGYAPETMAEEPPTLTARSSHTSSRHEGSAWDLQTEKSIGEATL